MNKKPAPELPKQPSAVIIPFPRAKRPPSERTVVLVPDDKLEAYLALMQQKDPKGAA